MMKNNIFRREVKVQVFESNRALLEPCLHTLENCLLGKNH
jgi:hypothetical protein